LTDSCGQAEVLCNLSEHPGVTHAFAFQQQDGEAVRGMGDDPSVSSNHRGSRVLTRFGKSMAGGITII